MSYIKWTNELKEKFIKMYPSCSIEELQKEFPVSEKTIKKIASSLKVKRENTRNSNYTSREDEILLCGISNGKTVAEIQEEIPWRSIKSIQSRLEKISDIKRQYWTDEEENLLKCIYETLPLDETMQMFPNRTRNAIVAHAMKLGLHAYIDTRYYSPEEEAFIRDNYNTMSDKEISMVLGRSLSSIKNHRVLMGIYRKKPGNTNYENVSIYVRRHNQQWKKDSMKNCNFVCVITGERFDEIHHLVSLNSILKNVYNKLNLDENNFNINELTDNEKDEFLRYVYEEQSKYPLGICLKKDIHNEFHKQYGYGNNTVEQFEEFLRINYSNVQLNVA